MTSGPYTTNDGLTFSPLEKFLTKMEDQQPDILVMHGPFLAEEHKLVKFGRFEVNGVMLTIHMFYCEIWKMIVNSLPKTKIVIIPSVKDVLSMYPLPQPNWSEQFKMFKDILFLSNPSSFELD